ncbi:hypothetical protein Q3G72_010827 [Acer saccharum]|nr:hypothetical protein Q3G72_010827 [Acer saccharum]
MHSLPSPSSLYALSSSASPPPSPPMESSSGSPFPQTLSASVTASTTFPMLFQLSSHRHFGNLFGCPSNVRFGIII